VCKHTGGLWKSDLDRLGVYVLPTSEPKLVPAVLPRIVTVLEKLRIYKIYKPISHEQSLRK
jgi:hypothetical protein